MARRRHARGAVGEMIQHPPDERDFGCVIHGVPRATITERRAAAIGPRRAASKGWRRAARSSMNARGT
jgi:hypothetical protein